MKIKQDPITKLYCREDGAILMPPDVYRFKKFRWTLGTKLPTGYRHVRYLGRFHQVHQIICRAFNGLPPEDKPFCDHINRIRDCNRPENLHWVDRKENNNNHSNVLNRADYGARYCEDKKSYMKAYNDVHREEHKAYWAAKAAEMKSKGLSYRKGPNGKYGWYPRICT